MIEWLFCKTEERVRVSRGVIIKAGLRNVCILLVEAAEAATAAAAASNVYIALRPRKKVCPRAAEKSIFSAQRLHKHVQCLFLKHITTLLSVSFAVQAKKYYLLPCFSSSA